MNWTNPYLLPRVLLRDGPNDLVMTIAAQGDHVLVSTAHFSTKVEPQRSSRSKGGALDMILLTLLPLLGMLRLLQLPGSRITPMRVDISRPRSK